jgi:hypothetical protein
MLPILSLIATFEVQSIYKEVVLACEVSETRSSMPRSTAKQFGSRGGTARRSCNQAAATRLLESPSDDSPESSVEEQAEGARQQRFERWLKPKCSSRIGELTGLGAVSSLQQSGQVSSNRV